MKFDEKNAGLAYSLSAAIPIIFQLIALLCCNILFSGDDLDAATKSNAFLWVMLFLNQAAFFVASFSIILRKKVDFMTELGIKKARFNYKYSLIAIVFTVALIFFMSPVVNYFVEFLKMLGYTPSGSTLPTEFTWYNYLLGFVIVCVLPAIFEETLFRGIIVNGLKNISSVFAIIISSLLFSLMHQRIEQMLHQFIFALSLSYIAVKQKSIIIPIIMHFVNNFLVLTLGYLPMSNAATFALMGVGAVVVIAIVLFEFLYLAKKRNAEEQVSDAALEKTVFSARPKTIFFMYALGGILFNLIMLIVGIF